MPAARRGRMEQGKSAKTKLTRSPRGSWGGKKKEKLKKSWPRAVSEHALVANGDEEDRSVRARAQGVHASGDADTVAPAVRYYYDFYFRLLPAGWPDVAAFLLLNLTRVSPSVPVRGSTRPGRGEFQKKKKSKEKTARQKKKHRRRRTVEVQHAVLARATSPTPRRPIINGARGLVPPLARRGRLLSFPIFSTVPPR